MKRSLGFAMLAACASVQAANWVSVGKINDGTQETFVDTDSIRVKGDLRRAWLKLVPAPHRVIGSNGGPAKWIEHELRREAFRCGDEYHRSEGLVTYFDDGSSFTTTSRAFPTPWEAVPPETAASVVMRFVCGWEKP